jgi:protein ImuB
MPRVMTIWLPRWPVQQRLLTRPELRLVPVFVCRRERRGVMRIVSWAWARPPRQDAVGRGPDIPAGTSLAEGMGMLALAHGSRACHVAEVCADDPAGDAAELGQVARWCRRFAPIVGIEAAAAPDCIHLDVTGTAPFFGGEAALARTAAWTLAARGLHARVAIADTCGASWAAAHHTDLLASPAAARGRSSPGRRRWTVVPAGAAASALAGLPATALRLDAAALGALGEVGIDSIGGVLRLSAKSLAARFPAGLVRRRAEFLGTLAEPLVAPPNLDLPRAAHTFDTPLPLAAAVADTIRSLLDRLVGRCTAGLAARGEGVLALQVRFEPVITAIDVATGRCAAAAPTVVDVGVFRPSGSARHLVDLAMLRLGRCRLPREVAAVAVEVVAAGRGTCRQKSLFASADTGAAEAETEAGMLFDRLAGRLGRAAVFEPRAVTDPQPEHAWIAAPPATPAAGPPAGRPARRSDDVPGAGRITAGRRPLWMPPRPVRIESLAAVVPEGSPVQFRLGGRWHRVARAHGPERIETAWWRGATVRRDYYVVETETGERFWVFHRLRDGGWFLHGVFA